METKDVNKTTKKEEENVYNVEEYCMAQHLNEFDTGTMKIVFKNEKAHTLKEWFSLITKTKGQEAVNPKKLKN